MNFSCFNLLVLMAAIGLPVSAQTLYVPGGTGGIGNNTLNGNVGIGTANPGAKLHIAGSGYVQLNPDDGSLELASGNDGYSFVDFRGSTNLASDFRGRIGYLDGTGFDLSVAGGLVAMNIRESGYVGIGTTNPNGQLGIVMAVADAGLTITDSSTNNQLNRGVITTHVARTTQLALTRAAVGTWGFDITPGGTAIMTAQDVGANILAMQLIGGNAGNVGIGTTSPSQKLHVAGNVLIDTTGSATNPSGFYFSPNSGLNRELRFTQPTLTSFQIQATDAGGTSTTDTPLSFQPYGGNVGIGTTTPTQKLSVNGTIQAKEVVVQTGWSDYVFDESYKLKALSEVESYVKTEHHLPGVPSAAQVAKEGIPVGEMQSKLLAKIEELTLHVIAQEKHQIAQEQRIEKLEAENAALRAARP